MNTGAGTGSEYSSAQTESMAKLVSEDFARFRLEPRQIRPRRNVEHEGAASSGRLNAQALKIHGGSFNSRTVGRRNSASPPNRLFPPQVRKAVRDGHVRNRHDECAIVELEARTILGPEVAELRRLRGSRRNPARS